LKNSLKKNFLPFYELYFQQLFPIESSYLIPILLEKIAKELEKEESLITQFHSDHSYSFKDCCPGLSEEQVRDNESYFLIRLI
jgi:hypothetical protein